MIMVITQDITTIIITMIENAYTTIGGMTTISGTITVYKENSAMKYIAVL